jgi:hypothetical protein
LPLAVGAQAQVREETVSDGRVSGVFFTPAKVPAPGIFVLHAAWGKVHPADAAYAKALAAAEFAAFAINYSGRGKPTWVKDNLDWMAKRPEVANQPLGSVGFSMGGRCAFYFALSPRVKAVISYYGTYDLKTTPVAAIGQSPGKPDQPRGRDELRGAPAARREGQLSSARAGRAHEAGHAGARVAGRGRHLSRLLPLLRQRPSVGQ